MATEAVDGETKSTVPVELDWRLNILSEPAAWALIFPNTSRIWIWKACDGAKVLEEAVRWPAGAATVPLPLSEFSLAIISWDWTAGVQAGTSGTSALTAGREAEEAP